MARARLSHSIMNDDETDIIQFGCAKLVPRYWLLFISLIIVDIQVDKQFNCDKYARIARNLQNLDHKFVWLKTVRCFEL